MRSSANFETLVWKPKHANLLEADLKADINAQWSFNVIYFDVTV